MSILFILLILLCFIPVCAAEQVIASDTLRYSSDAVVSDNNPPYIHFKTITLASKLYGTVRVSFEMKTNNPGASAYGRIYHNGVAIGTIRSTSSTSYVLYSEDISHNFEIGDTIQIYGGASYYVPADIKNFRVYFDLDAPSLLTPVNSSQDYFSYPDFAHDVEFFWTNEGDFNIKIAKDDEFNLISVDKIISTNSTVESLEPSTYYWKVRAYDNELGFYGNYSNVSMFYLIRNASSSGVTGIEGFVYSLVDGTPIPLSEATIYIRNEALNWSSSQLTGTNGYYLFNNLTNTTVYSISAKATGYEDSVTEYVTTIPAQRLTKNIQLSKCISGFNCFYNQQYVTFTVRNLFDVEFPGVTVTVYKGDELIAYETGLTDSGGSITFLLTKDQKYRVTFVGGGIEGTITYYVHGSQTNYRIVVVSGFPDGGDRTGIINTNLSSSIINATHSALSLAYNDSISSTTSISFYATNMTTLATCYSNSTAQAVTLNCTVPSTGTYRFGFTAISSVYGTIRQDKVINFGAGTSAGNPLYGKVDATLLHWGSIMLLVFVSAMFSIKTNKFGAIVIPAMALVLWSMQWLQVNFLLLATAMCIGVMVYMRMSEHKVEY